MKLFATTLMFLLSINITFAKPANKKHTVPKIIEELKIKKNGVFRAGISLRVNIKNILIREKR